MDLLAAGRDSDVFAYGDGLVLRRYRDGRPAAAEAATIRALRALHYPVPDVVSVEGPEIVMERIDGPNLADAMLNGMSIAEGARILARLHDALHALPWPGGEPLLHLDLHPLNVLVGPAGPVVIDWVNARPGPPGVDLAMTAILLGQVVAAPEELPPDVAELVAAAATELLAAFAEAVSTPYPDHLAEAVRLRRNDPSLSPVQRAQVKAAVEIVRAVTGWGRRG